jgi:mRNA-degrading endonuclease RelE of RelBE toxin-antitoxin system
LASKYTIEYPQEVLEHLLFLTKNQQVTVLDMVEKQLSYQPTVKTRNRKPMRNNPVAPWELRIGNIRVYYDVEEEPVPTVLIRAIGIKEHDIVRIGGKVIEL